MPVNTSVQTPVKLLADCNRYGNNGQETKAGDDLGLPGYDKLTGEGKVLYGQAWVDVTNENKAEYPF